MIKCVVFDFDGTLMQSATLKRGAFYEVTRELAGASDSLDEIFAGADVGDRTAVFKAMIERLSDRGDNKSPVAVDGLVSAYTLYCEAGIANCPEVPGATGCLEELNRTNVPVYVNSGTPVQALRRCLAVRSLTHHFTGIFGWPPSKADNLRAIMKHEGILPGAVVMVGDEESDAMAAWEVGCAFVKVGPTPLTTAGDRSPDAVLDDLASLPSLLLEFPNLRRIPKAVRSHVR